MDEETPNTTEVSETTPTEAVEEPAPQMEEEEGTEEEEVGKRPFDTKKEVSHFNPLLGQKWLLTSFHSLIIICVYH